MTSLEPPIAKQGDFHPCSGSFLHSCGWLWGRIRYRKSQLEPVGKALPDLILWGPSASPIPITRTFTNNDCEVLEGCESRRVRVSSL